MNSILVQINKIKEQYEILEKEANEFFRKITPLELGELVIMERNNIKYVSIRKSDNTSWDDCDERHILLESRFIKKNIVQYTEWLGKINNYEDCVKIKKSIGIKQMKMDNQVFTNMLLDTEKKLRNLKSEYIWEL